MRRFVYRTVRGLGISVVVTFAVVWLVLIWPVRVAHPKLELAKGILAIEHARIYISPTDPVIPDGTVVIADGRIAAVGAGVAIPPGATVLPCEHCVVMAGFWNAHVHFTQDK